MMNTEKKDPFRPQPDRARIQAVEDAAVRSFLSAFRPLFKAFRKLTQTITPVSITPALAMDYRQGIDVVYNQTLRDLGDRVQIIVRSNYQRSYEWARQKYIEKGINPKGSFNHEQFIIDHSREIFGYLAKGARKAKAMADQYITYCQKAQRESMQVQMFYDDMDDALHGNWQDEFTEITERIISDYLRLRPFPGESGLFRDNRQAVQEKIGGVLRRLFGDIEHLEINGRRYRLDRYIELVARTEMRMASAKAAINTAREWGYDLVRFSNHGDLDGKCLPYEGKIFSLSGQNPKYPPVKLPVYDTHPNCRHHIEPITDAFAMLYDEGLI